MDDMTTIWHEYHNQLLRFISSKVSDKEVAKDILHEVFIKIHTKIHTLEDPMKLKSWVYQISRNTIVDYYRSRKMHLDVPEWLEDESPLKNNAQVKEELSLCLGLLIAKLPEKYRQAIELSEMEGKTQQELAQLENISLSGAKSRVQRGRKMLKEMLFQCCELEISRYNEVISFELKDKNCKLEE